MINWSISRLLWKILVHWFLDITSQFITLMKSSRRNRLHFSCSCFCSFLSSTFTDVVLHFFTVLLRRLGTALIRIMNNDHLERKLKKTKPFDLIMRSCKGEYYACVVSPLRLSIFCINFFVFFINWRLIWKRLIWIYWSSENHCFKCIGQSKY